jgi:hypothetical protein
MNDDKARHRQLKRDIKKAGNRKRRRQLDRMLQEDPEGAAHHEADVGGESSQFLNGNDNDRTRRRNDREED